MNYSSNNNGLGVGLVAFIGGAIAWALFGQKIKDSVSQSNTWKEMKREVQDEVSQVKALTQEKYNQIVDEVTSRYARAKRISNTELPDLIEDLKMHWSKIKSAWDEENPTSSNIQPSV